MMYYTVKLISKSKSSLKSSVPTNMYTKKNLSVKFGTSGMLITKTYSYCLGKFEFNRRGSDSDNKAFADARAFVAGLSIKNDVKHLIIIKKQ